MDYINGNSTNLQIELVSTGLEFPTSMAFLGDDDILVLEKHKGTVRRIINGSLTTEPLLDVNVSNKGERGILGIAVIKEENEKEIEHPYVFLYFTEAPTKDGDDVREGKEPLGNRLYRYDLVEDKLINPKLLLDIQPVAYPIHNGGKLKIGPDGNVYLVTGDMGERYRTSAQNTINEYRYGIPDGTSGVLKLTKDGVPAQGVLGDEDPLNKYYAYGIRNSFGLDFDPLTGNLWITENGPGFGDEINLVEPGFNSGWSRIQGNNEVSSNFGPELITQDSISTLVDFGGKGEYSAPEFIWFNPVGVTALVFLNSSSLGEQYENDMFVGDYTNGNIYHFDLDKNRTALILDGGGGALSDGVANTKDELGELIFARGFVAITDLQVGPDGYLYILALNNRDIDEEIRNPSSGGSIYRIRPQTSGTADNG